MATFARLTAALLVSTCLLGAVPGVSDGQSPPQPRASAIDTYCAQYGQLAGTIAHLRAAGLGAPQVQQAILAFPAWREATPAQRNFLAGAILAVYTNPADHPELEAPAAEFGCRVAMMGQQPRAPTGPRD